MCGFIQEVCKVSSNVHTAKISPEVLRGPRLKAERSGVHIDEIIRKSQAIPKDWFDFGIKPYIIPPHMKPTRFNLTYEPLKPIPELFALMIGDAVHNLRGALDHISTGIIRSKSPTATPHFPICKNRDDLISDKRMAVRISDMETALHGSKELILNKIRPINAANDALWSFNGINNDDKHNLVIPTVAVANIAGLNANIGGSTYRDCGAGNDAAKPFVAISSDTPFTLQGDPQASVNVSFGPATPFNGKPVIPTLLDIRALVEDVICEFEILISQQS